MVLSANTEQGLHFGQLNSVLTKRSLFIAGINSNGE